MNSLTCACRVVAGLAVAGMATVLLCGPAGATPEQGQKAVPLKVVVLIDAKTKGISKGVKIERIETSTEKGVAKRRLSMK